jgi:hypothetical protein
MVSYRRSSDCTIIYEFSHVFAHWLRDVDDLLSVLSKGVELNVEERQVVSVNDLRQLSVVNHVIDYTFDTTWPLFNHLVGAGELLAQLRAARAPADVGSCQPTVHR